MLPALPSLRFQPKFYPAGPSSFLLPLLYDLVASRRPGKIVTLGFSEGVHLALAQATVGLELGTRLFSVRRAGDEENPDDDAAWQKTLAEAGNSYPAQGTLIAGDPVALAASTEDGSVDLLLLDDCDSGEVLRRELLAWQPKLAPNALILLDGLNLEREDSPRAVWEEARAGRASAELSLGLGLGLISLQAEVAAESPFFARLFGPPEGVAELAETYQLISARLASEARRSALEQRNAALELRQVWLDTLLADRATAQGVMDELSGQLRDLRAHTASMQSVLDDQARELEERQQAFLELRRDRIKAQLVMDAQAEQLKQAAARHETLSGEFKKLKARADEQKRVLNAARKACRKKGRCFALSPENKPRRSIPERILRELKRIPSNLSRAPAASPPGGKAVAEPVDRYAEWIAEHEPDAAGLAQQIELATELPVQPKISLLLPIFQPPLDFLDALAASLAAQTYQNFEICVVDGGSDEAARDYLKTWQQKEPRMLLEFLPQNLGIAENTNRAVARARGDFLACIDQDDLLPPFALYELARAIGNQPAADIFYSDEDRLTITGKRHAPFFKPEWSPEYLLSSMYLGHLTAYGRELVARLGGFRPAFDLSQDYDFALRATEQARAVGHIPHVLYHWREHPASGSAGGKPDARQSNLAALAEAMRRRNLPAEIIEYPSANRARLEVPTWPRTSIIVPTDSGLRARFCAEQLAQKTSYPDLEIVLVTNSGLVDSLEVLAPASAALRYVRYDEPFNFSEKCNLGAAAATGARLIFLNDDVEPGQPDWIQNLIEPLENPAIGAVAPKLLYETGKIQHAGLVTGVRGLVGTSCHQWAADSTDYVNFAQSMRDVSALSGACLALRRDDFFAFGPWDAVDTPVAHSDFDLCFKIRAAGMRCVYTPFVTMTHRGHESIGAEALEKKEARREKASVFLLKRWPEYTCHDPYFPDNLRDWLYADSPTPLRMAARARPRPVAPSTADLLIVSHDLSWSGAPLILLHLAKWCQARGYFITVMSPKAGPLGEHFVAAGFPVIVDPLIARNHPSFTDFAREFDCVIASTIFGAPIVRSAKAAGLPHFWWIHEGRIAEHYLAEDAGLRGALATADFVVTPDTRSARVYQPFSDRRVRVLPYGIPDPRTSEAEPAGRSPDGRVKFLLLGTIEDRKGQKVFLEAWSQLSDVVRQKARCEVVGRPHDAALAEEIRAAAAADPSLTYRESVTHSEALALIRAADVMLSTSWDETGPLISIEALALGTPILSTTVGGVAEILLGEEAGLFFAPGDSGALAVAIERLVRDEELLARLAAQARPVYEKYFAFDRFGEGFLELLHEAMADA